MYSLPTPSSSSSSSPPVCDRESPMNESAQTFPVEDRENGSPFRTPVAGEKKKFMPTGHGSPGQARKRPRQVQPLSPANVNNNTNANTNTSDVRGSPLAEDEGEGEGDSSNNEQTFVDFAQLLSEEGEWHNHALPGEVEKSPGLFAERLEQLLVSPENASCAVEILQKQKRHCTKGQLVLQRGLRRVLYFEHRIRGSGLDLKEEQNRIMKLKKEFENDLAILFRVAGYDPDSSLNVGMQLSEKTLGVFLLNYCPPPTTTAEKNREKTTGGYDAIPSNNASIIAARVTIARNVALDGTAPYKLTDPMREEVENSIAVVDRSIHVPNNKETYLEEINTLCGLTGLTLQQYNLLGSVNLDWQLLSIAVHHPEHKPPVIAGGALARDVYGKNARTTDYAEYCGPVPHPECLVVRPYLYNLVGLFEEYNAAYLSFLVLLAIKGFSEKLPEKTFFLDRIAGVFDMTKDEREEFELALKEARKEAGKTVADAFAAVDTGNADDKQLTLVSNIMAPYFRRVDFQSIVSGRELSPGQLLQAQDIFGKEASLEELKNYVDNCEEGQQQQVESVDLHHLAVPEDDEFNGFSAKTCFLRSEAVLAVDSNGRVGIGCCHCSAYATYPKTLSDIPHRLRLVGIHWQSCPNMPHEVRKHFESLSSQPVENSLIGVEIYTHAAARTKGLVEASGGLRFASQKSRDFVAILSLSKKLQEAARQAAQEAAQEAARQAAQEAAQQAAQQATQQAAQQAEQDLQIRLQRQGLQRQDLQIRLQWQGLQPLLQWQGLQWQAKKKAPRQKAPRQKAAPWSKEEDAILMKAVATSTEPHFPRWADLAQRLPGRDRSQIRARWVNYLNPKRNDLPFSREDNLLLWEGHKKLGRSWVEIAKKYFNSTRSGIDVSNRWKSASFKKFISNEFGPDAYNGGKEKNN